MTPLRSVCQEGSCRRRFYEGRDREVLCVRTSDLAGIAN